MQIKPLVSLIIPAYNRGNLIAETLDSVLYQTYKNWECIVVDDGSTDNTEFVVGKYLKQDSRFSFYKRSPSYLSGGNGARNYGADLSKGFFLIFLDSDDLLLNNCIEKRVKIALENPDYDMWIFQTQSFYKKPGDNNIIWNYLDKKGISDLKRFLENDMPWNIMSPLWKKSFFIKIGKFDQELLAWQDWEIHVRALLNNLNVYKSDEKHIDCYYRISQENSIAANYNHTSYKINIENTIFKLLDKIDLLKLDKEYFICFRNIIFRNIYNYYLNNFQYTNLNRLRFKLLKYKLINNKKIILLYLLDSIYIISIKSYYLIKNLIYIVGKYISNDYLFINTQSTFLKVKAKDL